MRRFYSLLLTAAFLLVGMNVLAAVNQVTVTYNSGSYTENPKTFGSLQAAINSIQPGDTATIVLDGDQKLTQAVCIPQVSGTIQNDANAQNYNPDILNRTGQRICLDLNNHVITEADGVTNAIGIFQFLKGTLHLTGTGSIEHTKKKGTGNPERSAILIGGAPATQKQVWWTTLIIDKDVFVNATGANDAGGKNYAITIDACGFNSSMPAMMAGDGKSTMNTLAGYKTNSYYKTTTKPYSYYFYDEYITNRNITTAGCAYGVRVYINGATLYGNQRAINIGGNINAAPDLDEDWTGYTAEQKKHRKYPNPAEAGKPFYYDNYYPYIKVGEGSKLLCRAEGLTDGGNGGIYAGGYVVMDVEGSTIEGQSGIFMKSGDIELDNTTVKSTSTGKEVGGEYGDNVAGTAVFITSDQGYAGDIKLHVTGESTIQGGGETAIYTATAANAQSETQLVIIAFEGGTIIPGDEGAIAVSTENKPKTTLTGGNITGNVTVDGALTDVTTFVPNDGNHHTTIIEDADGNKVVAVSEGVPPVAGNKVSNQADNASVKWEGSTYVEDEITGYLRLKELEINDTITAAEHAANNSLVTGAARVQTLYVRDGAILEVGRVVLGPKARVIVEAGGKFIVTGKDGIAAIADDNITLKTQESKPSIFLLNPDVKTNRCPMAKVEFTSKSCYRKPAKENIFQRFGIPMKKDGLESIECAGNHETRFYVFNYAQNKWDGIGYINPSAGYEDQPLDYTRLNDPFEYYQLLDFDVTTPSNVVYTMKGNLLGNSEPVMKIFENSWKGFANSYMGKMQLSELLALIPNTVDKAIYTYNVNAAFASWEPVSNLNVEGKMLNPMQPFLIRNRYAAAEVALDYEATVYNPTMGIVPNGAPSRGTANDFTMATITIANEINSDYVIVAEDAQFSAEFDNGYDASKFMNDEINLYVEAEENMSIFATDNLENTTLGVSSVLGGKYTITFSNVKGDNFVLVDNLTGAQAAMVEGNSYEFEMEANTVNSHRFAIVPAAKMPTALENAEVKANVKGVYTLMGQYVGEKIDELPAGVYVVDGVKIVK